MPPELVDVHRVTHAWENAASLELRYGRIPVIGTYLDHNRIHYGDAEAMTDAAHIAWRRDRRQEVASVLIAETYENVTALNVCACADLILDGTLKPWPRHHPVRRVGHDPTTGARFGNSIVLSADHLAEHVDLGYAGTAHRAQGVIVDTAHVLVEPTSTRDNFYVAMTRGKHANRAYVILDRPDE